MLCACTGQFWRAANSQDALFLVDSIAERLCNIAAFKLLEDLQEKQEIKTTPLWYLFVQLD